MSRQRVLGPVGLAPFLCVLLSSGCESAVEQKAAALSVALSDDEGGKPQIEWGIACGDEDLDAAGAVCGTLSVPLDHEKPHGAKIKLALSKIAHTVSDAEYQGVMIVNPGGPGGSGLFMATFGAAVPNEVGQAYDWIGFDPRGVGLSEPAISCDESYFVERPEHQYVPDSSEVEDYWLDRTERYAHKCGESAGDLLEHMRTTDNVRDIESIREALHAHQINYYGVSYGTYIGEVYASKFPERVRRMVLDSNIDPRRVWYGANLDQNYAVQGNVEAFWAWIAEHNDVYGLGASKHEVEKAWYEAQQELSGEPARGVVGSSEWTDLAVYAGYGTQGWPRIGAYWAAWKRGEPESLVDLFSDSGSDNDYAVYLATECTDEIWPLEWSQWRDDNWESFERAPVLTWSNAWFNAPCLSWPAPAAPAFEVGSADAPAILLLGETLDGATPFAGSLEARRRFPSSVLVATIGGRTHGNALAGNACVDDRIADYLATGELPERADGDEQDVSCDALPLPEASIETEDEPTYAFRQGISPELREKLLRVATHR